MRSRAIALLALVLASAFLFFRPDSVMSQSNPPPGADTAVGKVVTTEGTATIDQKGPVLTVSLPSGPVPAKAGDLLYKGAIIQTGADGKLGLVFADGTALNVLTNARMELNEFVYDPNSKWNKSAFNLVKGTFNFVGGKMAKTGDLRVNTPTATMGIRGTSAQVVIAEDGTTKFSTLIEDKQ